MREGARIVAGKRKPFTMIQRLAASAKVAIMSYALGVLLCGSGLVLAQPVPSDGFLLEKPTRAAAFVDSIGVNVHFDQFPYNGQRYSQIAQLLVASGIKHARDGLDPNSDYLARLNGLSAKGMHFDIITALNDSDALLASFPSTLSGFETYEGPNEVNATLDPDWAPKLSAFMQRLHADVHGTPSLSHYPIIAPSLIGGASAATALGSLAPYVDYGNMHNYFAEFNPETKGWGRMTPSGVYGSLAYNMNLARIVGDDKPIVSTENGYPSTPGGGNGALDYVTDGKYIPRLLFTQYNAGVVRTFIYEFLDLDNSGRIYTNYGLVDTSLQPKPAYRAVQAMIADLRDTNGGAFAPTPLRYKLVSHSNVQHTLLEKPDGSYYLALWVGVANWVQGQRVDARPQTVTLQ